ncbi:MAG: FeoA domain-containing protein [bacterium JZ-2024 1]
MKSCNPEEFILRKKRLFEWIYEEILDLTFFPENVAISEFELDELCTRLAHPRFCPHGKPIPMGQCCRERRVSPQPLFVPLSEIPTGEEVRVVFLPLHHPEIARQLYEIGLYSGTRVRILTRNPATILQVEETQIAVDDSFLSEVYVRRKESGKFHNIFPSFPPENNT